MSACSGPRIPGPYLGNVMQNLYTIMQRLGLCDGLGKMEIQNLGSVRFRVHKRSGGGCSVYLATFQSEAPPDRQARQIRTPYRI